MDTNDLNGLKNNSYNSLIQHRQRLLEKRKDRIKKDNAVIKEQAKRSHERNENLLRHLDELQESLEAHEALLKKKKMSKQVLELQRRRPYHNYPQARNSNQPQDYRSVKRDVDGFTYPYTSLQSQQQKKQQGNRSSIRKETPLNYQHHHQQQQYR
eukprot:m.116959 g.116959  ORF g.116959 m.116959 type:complete len:155 (+) comp9315_c2_seq1:5231-5695(+)